MQVCPGSAAAEAAKEMAVNEHLVNFFGSEAIAWAVVVLVALMLLVGIALAVRLYTQRRPEEGLPPVRRRPELELTRAREGLLGRIQELLAGKSGAEAYGDLEEILVTSDFGIDTTEYLIKKMRAKPGAESNLPGALRESILDIFREVQRPFELTEKPTVVMVVGVNGVGKTTSIGKVSAQFSAQGKKVLLGAGDTFRAAAIEQLGIWAERSGADIVKGQPEGDPAAVCFDAVKAGQARDVDLVICDTAGRLHTKSNLMEELKKVRRVMEKALPGTPHEVWLVVDATTGQNALSQARLFNDAVRLTGVIMTKLDGTAKGGTLVGLVRELKIPVRYIGVGEGIDDLRSFDPEAYVNAILG
jgi:fused signal recognition particle receptor